MFLFIIVAHGSHIAKYNTYENTCETLFLASIDVSASPLHG